MKMKYDVRMNTISQNNIDDVEVYNQL